MRKLRRLANKEYRDYGAVDFGDHQTEQAEEQYDILSQPKG